MKNEYKVNLLMVNHVIDSLLLRGFQFLGYDVFQGFYDWFQIDADRRRDSNIPILNPNKL